MPKTSVGLKINYNFSPSIAFAGNRFVVASTKAVGAYPGDGQRHRHGLPDDAARVVNTDVVLHFDALREILTDNRSNLSRRTCSTKGTRRTEAEQDIGEYWT